MSDTTTSLPPIAPRQPESGDIAIRVSNLSKCYQFYNQPQDGLKQTLFPQLQRLAGKPQNNITENFGR